MCVGVAGGWAKPARELMAQFHQPVAGSPFARPANQKLRLLGRAGQ